MLKLSLRRMAKDPFQVLELTRSASKADVKSKYRELAKVYHPDSPNGDTKRMEEINRAYHLLLKEGAYERFHTKLGQADAARPQRRSTAPRPFGGQVAEEEEQLPQYTTNPSGPSGIFGERRHPRPFTDDTGASPLDDQAFAKLVGLDAETERLTPDGKYMYMNRDTGEYVTLDRPLLKAKASRYGSHRQEESEAKTLHEQHRKQQASSRALWEELQRKSGEAEAKEHSKTWLDRIISKLEDSGSLPTRNKAVLVLILGYSLYLLYCSWAERRPRLAKDVEKISFYNSKKTERRVIEEQYLANAENFNSATAAAAIIFLAAASKKSIDDQVIQGPMDEFQYSIPRRIYRILAFT